MKSVLLLFVVVLGLFLALGTAETYTDIRKRFQYNTLEDDYMEFAKVLQMQVGSITVQTRQLNTIKTFQDVMLYPSAAMGLGAVAWDSAAWTTDFNETEQVTDVVQILVGAPTDMNVHVYIGTGLGGKLTVGNETQTYLQALVDAQMIKKFTVFHSDNAVKVYNAHREFPENYIVALIHST